MKTRKIMLQLIPMSDFLPLDVQSELDAQRRRDLKRRSRIRVQVGDALYPVLRLSSDSFTLDATEVTQMRGRVDLYDGARHLSQCLVMASDVIGGELVCTMKWSRRTDANQPLDYERDENAPRGFLPPV